MYLLYHLTLSTCPQSVGGPCSVQVHTGDSEEVQKGRFILVEQIAQNYRLAAK